MLNLEGGLQMLLNEMDFHEKKPCRSGGFKEFKALTYCFYSDVINRAILGQVTLSCTTKLAPVFTSYYFNSCRQAQLKDSINVCHRKASFAMSRLERRKAFYFEVLLT